MVIAFRAVVGSTSVISASPCTHSRGSSTPAVRPSACDQAPAARMTHCADTDPRRGDAGYAAAPDLDAGHRRVRPDFEAGVPAAQRIRMHQLEWVQRPFFRVIQRADDRSRREARLQAASFVPVEQRNPPPGGLQAGCTLLHQRPLVLVLDEQQVAGAAIPHLVVDSALNEANRA